MSLRDLSSDGSGTTHALQCVVSGSWPVPLWPPTAKGTPAQHWSWGRKRRRWAESAGGEGGCGVYGSGEGGFGGVGDGAAGWGELMGAEGGAEGEAGTGRGEAELKTEESQRPPPRGSPPFSPAGRAPAQLETCFLFRNKTPLHIQRWGNIFNGSKCVERFFLFFILSLFAS